MSEKEYINLCSTLQKITSLLHMVTFTAAALIITKRLHSKTVWDAV